MTHLLALIVTIIGTGLIAMVFPKAMVLIFERFPEHFKPQNSASSTTEQSNPATVTISKKTVVEALENPSDYKEPQLVGPGHILIQHRDSNEAATLPR